MTHADKIIEKARQSSGEAFQRFVDNWWQDTAQLAKENPVSERPKPEFPPEDKEETPVERSIRFFRNGLRCGAWDKVNGRVRHDVSRSASAYSAGYNEGWIMSQEDPKILHRQQIERAHRILADHPEPNDIVFMGVGIDNFNHVEVKKICHLLLCKSQL